MNKPLQSFTQWIWQYENWTDFVWDEVRLQPKLRECWKLLGQLLGFTQNLNVVDYQQSSLNMLLNNIISSSAIEGEQLNRQSVRSSLAKRLGLSLQNPYPTSDRSEGVSEITFDALQNWEQDLDLERLLHWHSCLFPYSEKSLHSVLVGTLRGDDPMQVVSGRIEQPKVHFEAPPRFGLEQQLEDFIQWFNQSRHDQILDPLLRAGICHLWLLTLHPFDDGNGRMTRALTDLALAQADQQTIRLYAVSAAILEKRQQYYQMLEQSQKGSSDITEWLVWFLDLLIFTLVQSLQKINRTLEKTRFWAAYGELNLSEAQRKVLNRLLDGGKKGFEQGINAGQYQKVAKVSKATATRHLSDLLEKGILTKTESGGRSTRYQIAYPQQTSTDPCILKI